MWSAANMERESFILLPSRGYTSFREEGVDPGDRVALTRLALEGSGLTNPEEDIEDIGDIIKAASKYWTEYSTRASVTSMARALGTAKEAKSVPQDVVPRVWTSYKSA